MKLPVVNFKGAAKGEAEIADDVLIKNGKGTQAVHDSVVAYLANQRLGTAKTKLPLHRLRQNRTGGARCGRAV